MNDPTTPSPAERRGVSDNEYLFVNKHPLDLQEGEATELTLVLRCGLPPKPGNCKIKPGHFHAEVFFKEVAKDGKHKGKLVRAHLCRSTGGAMETRAESGASNFQTACASALNSGDWNDKG